MRSVLSGIGRRGIRRVAFALLAPLLVGCSTVSRAIRTDAEPAVVAPAVTAEPADRSLGAEMSASPVDVLPPIPPLAAASLPRYAQAQTATDAVEPEAYDPWEPFNETMFEFNIKLDKYVLKPAANVYRHVIPEPFQVLIANGFDNIRWVPRFVNNLLQGKIEGAGREMARFLINSTAGIGGLFDPAKDYWGIRASKEDFGQTLGVWGLGPGPYLVLPLLPPLTVRDGIGYGVDSAMDPLAYVLPFFWNRLGMRLGDTLNERALNYDLFQGVEETTIDLYSSVRHFYLQRRERQIQE